MVSIASIIIGFMALLGAELRYLWKNARLPLKGHRFLQTFGYALIALGFAIPLIGPTSAQGLPEVVRAMLLILALLGGTLLAWTTFLEIPTGLAKFRIAPGHVYTLGSYSRCRHPGFWWFLLFSASLTAWEGGKLGFARFFMANALNLLLILLQDKYTFPLQFVNYREYTAAVPFLIPRLPRVRKHERRKKANRARR